ncbi:hypothetical protein ALC57_14357 [Trachymyrmex cornetzi]|uniref:Uncharacterized protein n=1 Tax=Trachymyrmex cornetzi TaxID=471704 RepID=A0A195DLG9_9HYME|nr:hypothetical protein ALC57_14357 [Trachymyrmex cornetzi]
MFTVDRDFDRQSSPCRCYSIGCAFDFDPDYDSDVWTASGCRYPSYTNKSCPFGDSPPGNFSRCLPCASWTWRTCTWLLRWTSFEEAGGFHLCSLSFCFSSFPSSSYPCLCPCPCVCLRPSSSSCGLGDLVFALALLHGHVVAFFASVSCLAPRAPRIRIQAVITTVPLQDTIVQAAFQRSEYLWKTFLV